MPFLFQYLVKFSLSLAVLFTFYYFVLRPLTFYQWNRFYLLSYSLLSFIIPFINITDWLTAKQIDESYLVSSIPVVDRLALQSLQSSQKMTSVLYAVLSWNVVGMVFLAGAILMLVRIVYQYLSLHVMKRKAVLLKTGGFEFYDVDDFISPFSFANAIFINSRLHTEEEFHRILEHEFVHVKQKHTIDIVIAEFICVLNWFNPFAWLIRKSIRQNLEFIADKNVLQGGIEPRQYQYLLLKVMGLPQYRMGNNFSFSSLKLRISMMNKIKTGKVHLIKFLFVLPLLSVMLLAFRHRINFSNGALTLTYAGIIINAADNSPLKDVVIRELTTNTQILTNDKGFFSIRLPVENEKAALRFNIIKDGDLRKELTVKWIKSAPRMSEAFIGLVGLADNLKSTAVCDNCFVYQDQVVDKNGLFLSDISYEMAQNHLGNYLQARNDMRILGSTSNPITKIGNRLYISSANFSKPGVRPSAFLMLDLNLTNELPLIYKNGRLSSIENVNATTKGVAFKQMDHLGKAAAIKKYGKAAEIINIITYSGIGSDTIPHTPVPPAPPIPAASGSFSGAPVPPVSPAPVSSVSPPAVAPVKETPAKVPLQRLSLPVTTVKPTEVPLSTEPVAGKNVKVKAVEVNGVNFVTVMPVAQANKVTEMDTVTPHVRVRGVKPGGGLNEPLYILDGEKLAKGETLDGIDPDNIEAINVLKGAPAMDRYGLEAVDGVVEVLTKNRKVTDTLKMKTKGAVTINSLSNFEGLFILDSKEITKEKLSHIDANAIESVSVLKNQAATDVYNDKGKKGVIIITTKRLQ
jgi:hypothetical protein